MHFRSIPGGSILKTAPLRPCNCCKLRSCRVRNGKEVPLIALPSPFPLRPSSPSLISLFLPLLFAPSFNSHRLAGICPVVSRHG
eukprot:1672119-Pyramimonas_sp.AAC.2